MKVYRSTSGKQGVRCAVKASEYSKAHQYNARTRARMKRQKQDHCEKCGWRPVHDCQLEIDHIDGNWRNNTQENRMTLCANCHRLKTYQPEIFQAQKHD